MLCDKHIVKMVLETAQMLCTALTVRGQPDQPYKPTHKNHPCTLWTGETRANFDWLVSHGYALGFEYMTRYPDKYHKSLNVIMDCGAYKAWIPDGPLTEQPQCMPDEFRGPDIVQAYRLYYVSKLDKMKMTWTNREPPYWLEEMC
jgi:hypothetical protein